MSAVAGDADELSLISVSTDAFERPSNTSTEHGIQVVGSVEGMPPVILGHPLR